MGLIPLVQVEHQVLFIVHLHQAVGQLLLPHLLQAVAQVLIQAVAAPLLQTIKSRCW